MSSAWKWPIKAGPRKKYSKNTMHEKYDVTLDSNFHANACCLFCDELMVKKRMRQIFHVRLTGDWKGKIIQLTRVNIVTFSAKGERESVPPDQVFPFCRLLFIITKWKSVDSHHCLIIHDNCFELLIICSCVPPILITSQLEYRRGLSFAVNLLTYVML